MEHVDIELTDIEKKGIKALKRLSKTFPKTLWLFAGNGGLIVMKMGEDGDVVMKERGGVDEDYRVDHVDGIYADGGDF